MVMTCECHVNGSEFGFLQFGFLLMETPTWSNIHQPLLNELDQIPDLSWWSCPEDQAIPRIDKMRISSWTIEFGEDIIEDPTLEVRR